MSTTPKVRWDDLLLYPNESFGRVWDILKDDGTPYDLTAATGRISIRTALQDAASVVDWATGGTGLSLAGYQATLALVTHALSPGRYLWNMEITLADGTKIVPWRGRVVVERLPTQ